MSHRLLPFAILAALLGSVPCAVAGLIAWEAATPISGDEDVYTTGTLVSAYSLNAGAATVNGVTFQSGNGQLSTLGASFGFTGFALQYSGFGSGQAPFSKLSTAYRTLLANGDYANSGGVVPVITLRNLAAGHLYAVQVWENDSRPQRGSDFRVTLSSSSNSVDLYQNSTGSDGGTGQFVIGVFTADATTQSFTAQGTFGSNPDTYLNAIQLRDISDTAAATPAFSPEPGGITGATTVTISSGSGSTIYYTTDNSTPGLSSPHGEAGSGTATVDIPAPASVTIQAFAVSSGKANSSVVTASYVTAVPGTARVCATVINPSFEDSPRSDDDYTTPHGKIPAGTGVHGWQFGSSQDDSYCGIVTERGFLGSPKNIPQGWQAAFVQGTGRISQTITCPSAGSYLVRFRSRGRFDGGAGAETFAVTVDDQPVGTFTPPASRWMILTSSPTTLAAGPHVIAFSGTVPYSQS
ncbi:MAG: cbhB, partial [Akkermansiaceae bacterium]|nr:cbhB [Akkermansiaceae bacterium]